MQMGTGRVYRDVGGQRSQRLTLFVDHIDLGDASHIQQRLLGDSSGSQVR